MEIENDGCSICNIGNVNKCWHQNDFTADERAISYGYNGYGRKYINICHGTWYPGHGKEHKSGDIIAIQLDLSKKYLF